MLRTLLRDESNNFRVVEDPSTISEIVLRRDRLLWLDLERPSGEDFELIQEEFGLHPLAIEDAMSRHQRPKIDQYGHFYLVIFYTVDFQEPGTGRIPGRRGLAGSSFVRSNSNTAIGSQSDQEPASGPQPASEEEDVVIPVPVIQREGEDDLAGEDDERIVLNELTLFMGENFLITVHENPIPEIDEAARRWTQNVTAIKAGAAPAGKVPGTRSLLPGEGARLKVRADKIPRVEEPDEGSGSRSDEDGVGGGEAAEDDGNGARSRDVGVLLYSLLDTIVDDYFPVIDRIVERVELVEEQIFERYNHGALESIFNLKKDLLALRRVLSPERDVLNILTRRDLPIFDDATTLYFQDVYDHVVRVTDSIDIYRDLLSSALDGYLSMQSNRLNVTVQTLTSVSIILMSVAAITGWYGMNFDAMPELRSAWGYPGVMIAVVVVVMLELAYFKRKRWL